MTKNISNENGICPFMSTAVLAPDKIGGGVIDLGNGRSAQTINLKNTPLYVACVGPDCQLFDKNMNRCSFVTVPMIDYALERLGSSAGFSSGSSLMETVADCLIEIRNSLQKISERG